MSLDPISSIVDLVSNVVSKIWPDKTETEKAQLALALQEQLSDSNLDLAQTKVDEAQANNPSLFVSGPRPYIMWGLGTIVILYALLTTSISFAVALGYHVIPMPPLDPMVRDIVLGLLGLGTLTRTYEKRYNVQGNH